MNKEKIKRALAGLGIAGLITGMVLTTTSCQKSSDTEQADVEVEEQAPAEVDSTMQEPGE